MIRIALDPVCEMEIRLEDAAAVARFEGYRVSSCSLDRYDGFVDVPHGCATCGAFSRAADHLGR